MSWFSRSYYPFFEEDGPSQLVIVNKNGFNSSTVDNLRPGGQRLSPYYHSPSSHPSSSNGSASSYHNLIPPTTVASGFYFKQPHTDYNLPASSVWHIARYREDELPNHASNMAAAMYPRVQAQGSMPSRRFSVAALPPSSSSSSTSSKNGQPPNFNQRRRISVSRFQDIPASNYLAVPSFHEYRHQQDHYESPQTMDFVHHNEKGTKPKNKYRRKSVETSNKHEPRRQVLKEQDSSESQSSMTDKSDSPILPRRSNSEDRSKTPDPTASAPAFEFNSSHLPLRPPTINVNKLSSGASGSNSTPESQRIESRQMIRSNNYAHVIDVHKDSRKDNKRGTSLGERKIWSITKPGKICTHGGLKNCKECNLKVETMSQCSSVGPPPTFTAQDNYAPVRRKRTSCSCGVAFRISVVLFVIVMLFITAFIVYSEMVLKRQSPNVMDKM